MLLCTLALTMQVAAVPPAARVTSSQQNASHRPALVEVELADGRLSGAASHGRYSHLPPSPRPSVWFE
jgi:hypothetical protein